VTDRPKASAFIAAAEALAGIFQEDQVVFFGDGHQGVEVSHCPAHVDWHNAFGAGGDGAADGSRVQGQGGIYVDEDGDGADGEYALKTGDEGENGHDDFVACPDTQGSEAAVLAAVPLDTSWVYPQSMRLQISASSSLDFQIPLRGPSNPYRMRIPVSMTSLISLRSSGPNNSKPGIYKFFRYANST